MICPKCQADTRVLETRGTARRRECFNLHRFWTQEKIVGEVKEAGPRPFYGAEAPPAQSLAGTNST